MSVEQSCCSPDSAFFLSRYVLLVSPAQLKELPAEFGELSGLQVLSAAGNGLTSLPATIGNLTSLREVYLGGNPMTELPESIGAWTNIEEASFKGCKLKGIPMCVAGSWCWALSR